MKKHDISTLGNFELNNEKYEIVIDNKGIKTIFFCGRLAGTGYFEYDLEFVIDGELFSFYFLGVSYQPKFNLIAKNGPIVKSRNLNKLFKGKIVPKELCKEIYNEVNNYMIDYENITLFDFAKARDIDLDTIDWNDMPDEKESKELILRSVKIINYFKNEYFIILDIFHNLNLLENSDIKIKISDKMVLILSQWRSNSKPKEIDEYEDIEIEEPYEEEVISYEQIFEDQEQNLVDTDDFLNTQILNNADLNKSQSYWCYKYLKRKGYEDEDIIKKKILMILDPMVM